MLYNLYFVKCELYFDTEQLQGTYINSQGLEDYSRIMIYINFWNL